MDKNMVELIKQYQAGKNNDVIDKILAYIDMDLTEYGYDEGEKTSNDVDGLIYVAIKIRAHLLKDCFRERSFRFKYKSDAKDKADYKALFGDGYGLDNNFMDEDKEKSIKASDWAVNDKFGVLKSDDMDSYWIEDLADNPWLGVDVDELRKYNFDSVWVNKGKIEKHYGGQSHELFYLCKKFNRLSQDSEEFKTDFKNTKAKILPLFVLALEHALSKVDATKTNKEIVKFINMAMMTKFIEVQMAETGKKRVRTDGQSHYIKPVFANDTDNKVWMMMIGKSLAFVGADAFDEYLTKTQKQLMMDAYEIILGEYKDKDVEFFHWDKNGKAYLNKRKVAEKLGLSEANLKQKLKRIGDKIHSHWADIWSKKRKAM